MLTKDILLVRILSSDTTIHRKTVVEWGAFSKSGEFDGHVYTTQLDEIKQQWCQLHEANEKEISPNRVILLLPGNLAVHSFHTLNGGQKKHIHSALPYMIEDSLAEDVEQMHLVSHVYKKTDKVSLVAISHTVIQAILSVCEEVAFAPDSIYSECQLVRSQEDTAVLIADKLKVFMAIPSQASFTLDYEAVPFALSQRGGNCQNNAVGLEEVGAEEDKVSQRISHALLKYSLDFLSNTSNEKINTLKQWLNAQGWLYEEQVFESSIFELLAREYFEHHKKTDLINLRQGSYRCPKRASRIMAKWRPVLMLAICWLVIEVSIMAGQGIYFGDRANKLWGASANLYLNVFPQDQQVKSAKARNQQSFNLQRWLENRLKKTGKTNSRDNVFLILLHQLSMVTSQQGMAVTITPQAMAFNNEFSRLSFEFLAPHLESVNKLVSELREKGLQTHLDNTNQSKTGVIAKITIAR
ncbi:MAG: type II secretion system protein GspL [Endozoicomonas sp. (ex Botrylloides leachii)]|nr:type II secretion system protein GspL [Endozoicomonas sp. (ex Botrylloides leachii)]